VSVKKKILGNILQIILLAEVCKDNLNQCSTSRMVELPEHTNLALLYDLYVKKKKLSDRTNVNVLNDDDSLRLQH
jgi:hypothetical protein